MLYIFHGTDTKKVADRAHALVRDLSEKRPDAQVFRFSGDALDVPQLDELVEARGLFVEKHIVFLQTPLETAEGREALLERLERIARSHNVFVISEGKLLAEHKRLFERHAEKSDEYKAPETRELGFNVFSLGDALGTRDKKALWICYMQARRAAIEPESIHGTLHWATRSMLLARKAASAEEAGQKPFVYDKFKRYAGKYTEEELTVLSRSLVALYHDARRGLYELDEALERWVLGGWV